MRRTFWLCLAAGLLLSACQPASATATAAATATATPQPSATLMASPTVTATPTLTPTATASPTATPSATPTHTPLPTATRTATPDIYASVALSLDDLPRGFIAVTGADLTTLHLTDDDIRKAFGSTYAEAQLHNPAVFFYRHDSAFQIVTAFLFYPLSDNELQTMTNALYDPQAIADALLGVARTKSAAHMSVQVLKGLDDLGQARAGITFRTPQPSGPALRTDYIIVRRGRIAEFLLSDYVDKTKPAIAIMDLARILDGRVEAAQTPQ